MLQYDRISVSEGIDIDKTGASKVCIICHYWYFKDVVNPTFVMVAMIY